MGFNDADSIDRAAETVAPTGRTSRRTVLLGAGAVGAGVTAAAALAACGSGSAPTTPSAPPTGPIAKTTDIPVGGGKIFTSPRVVVTQPTQGTFKAFSSICTHQGCPVTRIDNGLIQCTCHGSEYSIVDGSVTRAAQRGQTGLPAEAITVADGEISIA
jgi:nitrite reductase/ring-hydroxylating ferredoxin subunit